MGAGPLIDFGRHWSERIRYASRENFSAADVAWPLPRGGDVGNDVKELAGPGVDRRSDASPKGLKAAASSGKWDIVPDLVKYCVDLKSEANSLEIAWAACDGQLDIITELTEREVDLKLDAGSERWCQPRRVENGSLLSVVWTRSRSSAPRRWRQQWRQVVETLRRSLWGAVRI